MLIVDLEGEVVHEAVFTRVQGKLCLTILDLRKQSFLWSTQTEESTKESELECEKKTYASKSSQQKLTHLVLYIYIYMTYSEKIITDIRTQRTMHLYLEEERVSCNNKQEKCLSIQPSKLQIRNEGRYTHHKEISKKHSQLCTRRDVVQGIIIVIAG